MVKIKIDGKEREVAAGTKVIEAAREAGYNIPSLCYHKDLPHYTSCMVCMVKNNTTGRYFASCSAVVAEGMDIDVSGKDVQMLRSRSVELLLTEHRAECEAPCRLVCPMDLDVPLMNRLIASGDMARASDLTIRSMGFPSTISYVCPAYCDNACRRKKVDTNISICRLKRHVALHPEKPDIKSLIGNKKGIKVAIAGAGPSGLSAAFRLAMAGFSVTIYEKENESGGSLLDKISDGTLPKKQFHEELNNLVHMGVTLIYGTTVDKPFCMSLAKSGIAALINATGSKFTDGFAAVDDSMAYEGDMGEIGGLMVVTTGGAIKDNLNAVKCFQYGKNSGEALIKYLTGSKSKNEEPKSFNSTLGKVEDAEWKVWAQESREGVKRSVEIPDDASATDEAAACMHCDCRAATNCSLRDLAADLLVKNPREKFTFNPIEKKKNSGGLIFEHAKCIKCGLCVRLGATLIGEPSLCFKGRGYQTMISEPLYHNFEAILNSSAEAFAAICPTGALMVEERRQKSKD